MAAAIQDRLRQLPGVDELASRLADLPYPRALVIAEARRAVDQAREELRAGGPLPTNGSHALNATGCSAQVARKHTEDRTSSVLR